MANEQLVSILDEDGGFPHDSIFTSLLPLAREVKRVIVHDPDLGLEATYDQLITDILHVRNQLKKQLSSQLDERGHILKDDYHIGVLAPSNYEFAVAAFAILALGGSVVALPIGLPPDVILEYLKSSPVKLILYGKVCRDEADKIQDFANDDKNQISSVSTTPIPIQNSCPPHEELWNPIQTDQTISIPATRPAIVWFSSGSTGIPKGIMHSRAFFHNKPRAAEDEALLVHRPASWVLGSSPIFSAILTGARAEIINPDATGAEFWERIKQRRVTDIKSSVMIYEKMARHWESDLSKLPEDQKEEFVKGAKHIRYCYIGGSMPPPWLVNFWKEEMRIPLDVGYGTTEAGFAVMTVRHTDGVDYERCMGRQLSPDIPLKLSEGDHGELLVGGITTFLGYLNGTGPSALLDEEGYQKTGDLVHKIGEYYIFDGRASVDFIKTNAEPVPVQKLEQALSQLSNVETALVIPVPDKVIGRRVGVIGRSKGDEPMTLNGLREGLKELVPEYMLPTAFRELGEEDELPVNHAGKVAKMEVMERYFPFKEGEGLPGAVQVCD
ncbi:class I adenylate-forming enzyme family protein [Aspergillus stella-maris]|uniref:class I adenylate-forming enzyme family protein n=1 Tax=Aspergillus stella-maris TaxID=1810926 RepID=UPI003CCD593A